MATIHDVARLAGVSSATVSRVINNEDIVSGETREKVNDAIKKLGYFPNHFSKNLRTQQSKVFLITISDFKNPFFGAVLKGMDEAAYNLGYQLLVSSHFLKPEREMKLLKLLNSRRVDGAALLTPVISKNDLSQIAAKYPIVQCCEYLPDLQVSHVSIHNFNAAYQVMRYFISKGHKRIAMLSVNNTSVSTFDREKAYIKAHEDFGVKTDQQLIRRGDDYNFENGMSLTKELLITNDLPTAVFAISDSLACGCIRALSEAKIRVPDDVEVMGFDNINVADMINPPLSTVSQPMQQIGITAINLLASKIYDNSVFHEIYLDHEIVLRKTTI